jgi:hypothetical protein
MVFVFVVVVAVVVLVHKIRPLWMIIRSCLTFGLILEVCQNAIPEKF